jgi:hypothetical protein
MVQLCSAAMKVHVIKREPELMLWNLKPRFATLAA